jgi:hypothetical protein
MSLLPGLSSARGAARYTGDPDAGRRRALRRHADLIRKGRERERSVLSRGVRRNLEDRALVSDDKTVVIP